MKHALLSAFFTLALAAGAHAQTFQSQGLFTGKDAEGVIESAIARQEGISDVKVTISQVRDEDILTQSTGVAADADGLVLDKARNRWEATLLLQQNGQNLAPIRLSGRYDQMAQVPILKRRVMPGEVISQDDIDWDKEPAQRLRKNTVTDPKDLIGKSPKHVLSQGRSIRLDEIANPAIINKGEKVTLLFKSHNIEIKTSGEALEPGAKGDVIKVRNPTSKTIIEGTVVSESMVRVSSPDSDSAEVTP